MNANVFGIIAKYKEVYIRENIGTLGRIIIKSENLTVEKFYSIKKDAENIIATVMWKRPECEFCNTKMCKPHKLLYKKCRNSRCTGIRFRHVECTCKKIYYRPDRTEVDNLNFEYDSPLYKIIIRNGQFNTSIFEKKGSHVSCVNVHKRR